MLRLQGIGSNTEMGVPYTEDEIMAIVRKRKQQGHLLGVGRVLSGQGTDVLSPPPPPPRCTHNSDFIKLKKSNKLLTKQVDIKNAVWDLNGADWDFCNDDVALILGEVAFFGDYAAFKLHEMESSVTREYPTLI
nr:hypothetical protein [Tanacetum cinerariifolium]